MPFLFLGLSLVAIAMPHRCFALEVIDSLPKTIVSYLRHKNPRLSRHFRERFENIYMILRSTVDEFFAQPDLIIPCNIPVFVAVRGFPSHTTTLTELLATCDALHPASMFAGAPKQQVCDALQPAGIAPKQQAHFRTLLDDAIQKSPDMLKKLVRVRACVCERECVFLYASVRIVCEVQKVERNMRERVRGKVLFENIQLRRILDRFVFLARTPTISPALSYTLSNALRTHAHLRIFIPLRLSSNSIFLPQVVVLSGDVTKQSLEMVQQYNETHGEQPILLITNNTNNNPILAHLHNMLRTRRFATIWKDTTPKTIRIHGAAATVSSVIESNVLEINTRHPITAHDEACAQG